MPVSRTRKLVLASLALFILLLGGFGVYYPITFHNTALMQQQATMTVVARITATARAKVSNITATAGPQASDVIAYDAAVAANGVMFGFNADHTHNNPYERILSPANVSNLGLDWIAGMATTRYSLPTTANYSSPAIASGIVYVGSKDGYLYAFDAKSGTQLWRASTGASILSSPAVVNNIVYIGSDRFYAFNAKSGSLLWKTHMSGGFISSPAVVNNVVYVGSDDDNLYALDAKTGKILWQKHTGGAIDSCPAVDNGVVYVGSKDGNLYAFNANNKGRILWQIPMGGVSSPAFVDGVVYVAFNSNLYAFDAETGILRWPAPIPAPPGFHYLSPAVANGIVYVGSQDNKSSDPEGGNLYAFDVNSEKQLWTAPAGNIESSPTIANGVVYVGSNNGNLYAYDAKSGANLWATPISVPIEASPTVAYGVVYVVSHDDKLYAFHLPGVSPY